MKNGFFFDDGEFPIAVGGVTLSVGQGVETQSRYSYDYSRRPQAIVRRRRVTARTGTLTIAFTASQVGGAFAEVARYEGVAGRAGELYWNGRAWGRFLVRSVQISLALDGVDVISSAQISLEIVEAYRPPTRASAGGKNLTIRL